MSLLTTAWRLLVEEPLKLVAAVLEPSSEPQEPLPQLLLLSDDEIAASDATLVVIDTQDNYLRDLPRAEAASFLEAVAREMRRAVAQHRAIVIVEMVGFGKTHASLRAIVRDYDKVATVTKPMPDGSEYVTDVCEKRGFNMDHFRLVGAFTHDCVWHTTNGLICSYDAPHCRVDVVAPACFPYKGRAFRGYSAILAQKGRLFLVG